MNLSKAWNTKLEAANFLLSKILYKKCVAEIKIPEIEECLYIVLLLKLSLAQMCIAIIEIAHRWTYIQ